MCSERVGSFPTKAKQSKANSVVDRKRNSKIHSHSMILGHTHTLLLSITPPPFRNLSRAAASPDRLNLTDSLQSETLKILEWPSLCNQLSPFTSTSMGLAAAQSAGIPLGRTPTDSRRLLDQTCAALAVPRPLDFSGIEDVSRIVEASVAGRMLTIAELCSVRRTLRSAGSLIQQLEEIALSTTSSV